MLVTNYFWKEFFTFPIIPHDNHCAEQRWHQAALRWWVVGVKSRRAGYKTTPEGRSGETQGRIDPLLLGPSSDKRN